MDLAIVTGIFTILGGLAGAALTWLQQSVASRQADRVQAQELFVQLAKAIGTMETERAVFRERRDSRRANFLAAGNAILHALAGRAEGNWIKGAASGTSALVAWDAAEGARFTDRYQFAASEAMSTLIRLSLISPTLQQTATDVGDALAATVKARKPGDIEAADKEARKAVAALRDAVTAYAGRERRLRITRGREKSREHGRRVLP
jgi:hypothetical protein